MVRHGPLTRARRAELRRLAQHVRDETIRMLTAIGQDRRGHPGAALSIADIVTALYFEVMTIDPARPDWPDRDRFVLSKGHGCPSLYVALSMRGYFPPHHLETLRSAGSILQGHPDMRKTPGVDMTSGSLGHGLSTGLGLALDARLRQSPSHVTVLLGDGELQEGLVWEGAMAAAKYRVRNLTAIVDCNGLQSGGRVADTMPVEPLAARWRAFGWRVRAIDGHDMDDIVGAVRAARRARGPTVILARTVKGKGVPYMEGDNAWHQACPLPVSDPPRRSRVRMASTRAAFGEAVLELARQGRDIVVVTADSCASMGLSAFAREFPARHVEVGIAEQNLMAIAAGLAAGGRTVFVATYAAFASMRALEQVRTLLAYPRMRVVIAAGLGGLSSGIEGVAHLSMEDLGIMRTVPGITVLSPSDAAATRWLVKAAADQDGPVYLRLGRDDSPMLSGPPFELPIGPGRVLIDGGDDVALLTTGLVTPECLDAARLLSKSGIHSTVAEFPTLKPFDHDLVAALGARVPVIITVEEHSVIGGLGSAVLEIPGGAGVPVTRIGIEDRFLESGTPDQLRRAYGLSAAAIARRVRTVLAQPGRKRRDDRVEHAEDHRGEGQRPGERKGHERE